MIETATFAQMRRMHQKWIDDDFFALLPSSSVLGATSLREFIHSLAVGNSVLKQEASIDDAPFPDLTDLHKTMDDVLAMSVRTAGGDLHSVRSIMFQEFCVNVIGSLAAAVAHDCTDDEVRDALFKECQVTDWHAWRRHVEQEAVAQPIALALFENLVEKVKDRTLFSFFVREPDEQGFLSWGPFAETGIGTALDTHTVDMAGTAVDVAVRRYEEHPDAPVTGYEWTAKVAGESPLLPDAVACGMVYVFEREDGEPVGDASDLLQVADSLADTDVLQVSAFLHQHQDAEVVIARSDLCFVWIWERRATAKPGVGALCLQAAVADLQTRFKRVKTVIMDTRPSQFVAWDGPKDPPMIEVAKQGAIERLVSYVQSLALSNVEIRHIFNHHEDNPHAALCALGEEGVRRRGEDLRMDDARVGHLMPEWEDQADELAELFHHAGLPELRDQVQSGTADYYEIERVLVHLLLHRRIPYLPLSMTPDVDLDALYGPGAEPDIDDIDGDAVEAFIQSLPEDVEVNRVRYCSGPIDGPGWVVSVSMDIGFTEIEEFFTLTPVPRPVDAAKFLGL